MLEFLSDRLFNAIFNNCNISKLCEVRLRAGREVYVNENSVFHKLYVPQHDSLELCPLICSKEEIEESVLNACEHSIYAYQNQIRQGFVTTSNGERIGLCGEIVSNSVGGINTIKNISSLVIRIPHEVINCSLTAQSVIFGRGKNDIKNTLIIAPPGAGKTTFLRDIARGFSKVLPELNVLICDERGEIACVQNGVPTLNVGGCDVLSFASKEYVFREGVRALRPDVLICDEIATEQDVISCEKLASQGVKLIASIHGEGIRDLTNKPSFNTLLCKQIFERYIILSSRHGAGTYEAIFDKNFEVIY